MTITPAQQAELLELSKPLMKWLNEAFHPHMLVIVEPDSVSLHEMSAYVPHAEFVKD